MRRYVAVAALAVACWIGAPAFAQEPPPVLPQNPESPSRVPVNTSPAPVDPPVRHEAPAKIDVTPDDRTDRPPAPGASPDVDEQRRGGGGGRGGAPRGGYRGPGRGPSGVAGPRGAFVGGWPSPVYFARPYYFDPFWASGAFAWSPMFYAPWSLMWGTAGYWPGAWLGSTTFNTGGVRLKVRPREAQVIVDGYYAGVVDEFDGIFQSLRLAPGGHKIEVRMPGFETLTFDVHVQPDRTLTLTETMRASP